MNTATAQSMHQDLIRNTTQHVTAIDPSHNIEKATPAASSPVPNSPELQAIGATRVGDEDSDVAANIEHALKLATSSVTGGSVWARMGKSKIASKILHKRASQKSQLKPSDFQSDLEIGE